MGNSKRRVKISYVSKHEYVSDTIFDENHESQIRYAYEEVTRYLNPTVDPTSIRFEFVEVPNE